MPVQIAGYSSRGSIGSSMGHYLRLSAPGIHQPGATGRIEADGGAGQVGQHQHRRTLAQVVRLARDRRRRRRRCLAVISRPRPRRAAGHGGDVERGIEKAAGGLRNQKQGKGVGLTLLLHHITSQSIPMSPARKRRRGEKMERGLTVARNVARRCPPINQVSGLACIS